MLQLALTRLKPVSDRWDPGQFGTDASQQVDSHDAAPDEDESTPLVLRRLERILRAQREQGGAATNGKHADELKRRLSDSQPEAVADSSKEPVGQLVEFRPQTAAQREDAVDGVHDESEQPNVVQLAELRAKAERAEETAAALQEVRARCERLTAQQSASEQALRESNRVNEDLRREHRGLVESLQEAQHQLQAAQLEAPARQEGLADQGTAELVVEMTRQQGALERVERQYHASVEAWSAEGQRIEQALGDLQAEELQRQYHASLETWSAEGQRIVQVLSDLRVRYDEMLRRSRDQSEHFVTTACGLERRCEQLTDNRRAVREVFESAVRTKRECYAVLADAQMQWQTKLAQ